MYYIALVEKLNRRGLSKENIKEYTNITIYEQPGYGYYGQPDNRDIELCWIFSKWGVPLLEILDKFPEKDPNVIYSHIKYHLQPFNAVGYYICCVRHLRAEGVPFVHIAALIEGLSDSGIPDMRTLRRISKGITVKRIPVKQSLKEKQVIEVIKYVKNKTISANYNGFFHLRQIFQGLQPEVLSKGLVIAKNGLIKLCNICGKEFIASNANKLFCNRCKKKAG